MAQAGEQHGPSPAPRFVRLGGLNAFQDPSLIWKESSHSRNKHACQGLVLCHALGLAEGPVVVSESSQGPRPRQDSV